MTPLREKLLDRDLIPDAFIRAGIRQLLKTNLQEVSKLDQPQFLASLAASPIAIATAAANVQHYEVPAEFFALCLGPRRKYSSCLYEKPANTLAEAEIDMLRKTCRHAQLEDGQRILELGCGWGSLSLWMARNYPKSTIVGVSNSASQREYIQSQITQLGLTNLEIRTADMNDFDPRAQFDRVVSVEMFEHMRNWPALLKRIRTWLHPSGKLFLHVFSHAQFAYPYEDRGPGDWMARYFFTGGIMPSHRMIYNFNEDLQVEKDWRINGNHYSRTLEDWLKNLDANRKPALALFDQVYGPSESLKWLVRWRVFLMACSELFSYRGGEEWGVSHYLLQCS